MHSCVRRQSCVLLKPRRPCGHNDFDRTKTQPLHSLKFYHIVTSSIKQTDETKVDPFVKETHGWQGLKEDTKYDPEIVHIQNKKKTSLLGGFFRGGNVNGAKSTGAQSR